MPFQTIPTPTRFIPLDPRVQLRNRQIQELQEFLRNRSRFGLEAQLEKLTNPLAGIQELIEDPQTQFNVVGVIIAIVLIVIGLIFVLRQAQ